MTDSVKNLIQRVDHLQKREAKLTRDLAVERKRTTKVVKQVKQLTEALRRGLPHMNLAPFLDDDIDEGEDDLG